MQLFSDTTNTFSMGKITAEDIDAIKNQPDCPICLDTLQDKTYQVTKTNPCPKSHYFHFNCLKSNAVSVLKFENNKFRCALCQTDIINMGYVLKALVYPPKPEVLELFYRGKELLKKSHTNPEYNVDLAINLLTQSIKRGYVQAKPFLAEALFLSGKLSLKHALEPPYFHDLLTTAASFFKRSLDEGYIQAKPFLIEAIRLSDPLDRSPGT